MRRREFLVRAGAGGAVAATLGSGVVAGQSEGAAAWRYGIDARVLAAPTVVDGTVYLGTEAGTLYALDAATGEERWRFGSAREFRFPPVVAEGTVYVGNDGLSLLALDAADGTEQWRFETDGSVDAVRVADGIVYAGGAGPNLHALDTVGGEEQWRFATGGSATFPPVVADGTVYTGAPDELYAIDAVDGAERWEFPVEPSPRVPPTVAGETVYVGATDANLYAIDTATGDEAWRFESGRRFGAPPAVAGDAVYVGTADADLHALDATTGDRRWLVETGGPVVGAPQAVDGSVYFATENRTLYAVAADGGEERWRFETRSGPGAGPTVADGQVHLGTGDGLVYAVAADSGAERWRFDTDGLLIAPPVVAGSRVYAGSGEDALYAIDARRAALLADTPTATPIPEGRGASSTLLTDVPDLALGGGALAALGGLAYAVATRVGGSGPDVPPDGSRPGQPSETGGWDGGPPADGVTSGTDPAEPTDVSDASVPRTGSGSGSAVGGTGGSPADGVPSSVPRALDLSLSYDDIERGDRIGAGGNADVYEAVVPFADGEGRVALKQPRFEGTLHAGTVERFAREAETWANLDDHDHVVGVVDWGTEPLPWLALEYMDGGDLGAVAGDLPLEQALWTARTVVEGVRHAHTRGVAHLDLKPANVLFRETDGWSAPKVADWGLARLMLESSRSVEGLSPAYAAPEQFAEDRGEVGQATDIYQFGAVLYELFTGQPPYDGPPVRVMNEILSGSPPDPLEADPGLPDGIGGIVTRAMATDQGDRYEDVLYLRDDLAELAGDR